MSLWFTSDVSVVEQGFEAHYFTGIPLLTQSGSLCQTLISGPASLENTEPIEGSGDYYEGSGSGDGDHEGSGGYYEGSGETFQDCGEDLEESTGMISSPWYPDPYPNNANCEWTITVDSGKKVYLNFSNFEVCSQTFG